MNITTSCIRWIFADILDSKTVCMESVKKARWDDTCLGSYDSLYSSSCIPLI